MTIQDNGREIQVARRMRADSPGSFEDHGSTETAGADHSGWMGLRSALEVECNFAGAQTYI